MHRILLVDDNPVNRALLESHLKPLGYGLQHAGTGREALATIEADPPDLVLLDVMMPDLDGIDVLLHLRARDTVPRLPVILVTALTDREYRVRGLEAGADDFLEKPVDRAVLVARVRKLLELRSVAQQLADRNERLEALRLHQRELTDCLVHDMRNPLGAILLNLQYLQQALPRDAARALDEAVGDTVQAAQRLDGMLGDLLLVARTETAGMTVERADLAIGPLLGTAAAAFEAAAAEAEVSIEVATDPAAVLHADERLVRRVIDNLLSNAIRHALPGGRVRIAPLRDGFTVANTGEAIPPALCEAIFERFVQGSGRQRGRSDVGLGLFFCRRVADAHGGCISVETTPEWPVRFTFSIPGVETP